MTLLFFQQIEDLIAMKREDPVPEIVDEFEHRERHLRRPEAGDLDRERTQVRGSILRPAHVLPPRR